ncbi:MAG: VOC family protein [Bacteroidota bacterium]
MNNWYLFIALGLVAGFSTLGHDTKTDKLTEMNKMEIQYAYTILYVEDVPRTMAFYIDAFGFEQKFITPENDYGEIQSGTTTLAFANYELGQSNFKQGFQASTMSEKPFGIELAFTTQEVEKVIKNAIKHGASLLAETVEKPWGQKVGYIRDINGFILEICTPIGN